MAQPDVRPITTQELAVRAVVYLKESDYTLLRRDATTYPNGRVYIESIITDTGTTVGINLSTGHEGVLHTAKSNAANITNLDTYDDGASYSILYLRKSDTDTIGTEAQTDSADVLGRVEFQGVNNTGPNFRPGAYITATQNGVANTYVPTDMRLETWTALALNTSQLLLATTGNYGLGLSTLDAWHSDYRAMQNYSGAWMWENTGSAYYQYLVSNGYYDGAWKGMYGAGTAGAALCHFGGADGLFQWQVANNVTADAAISWDNYMRFDSTGLRVGDIGAASYLGHFIKNQPASTLVYVDNQNAGNAATCGFNAYAGATNEVGIFQYGTGKAMNFGGLTDNGMSLILSESGNGLLIEQSANAPIYFATNNAWCAQFSGAGDLGLGAASPANTRLTVADTTNCYLDIVSDSDANGANDDAYLRCYVDGVAGTGTQKAHFGYNQGEDVVTLGYGADLDVRINTAGNIGLGVNPLARLDLYGSGCPPGSYQYFRHEDVDHGMTTYADTTAFGLLDCASGVYGGFVITGLSSATLSSPLHLRGFGTEYCSGGPFMIFQVAVKSGGTGVTFIGNAYIGFAWYDYTQLLMSLDGDGDLVVTGDIKAGTGYLSTDGSAGATGSFEDNNGNTVTVKNGLITDFGT